MGAIELDFALNDETAVSIFTLVALLGSSVVGTVSAVGTLPGGVFIFPEGEISFSATAFDSLRLSSTAPDFAIDNLAVTFAPEPGALALVLLALGGLGFSRRTRSYFLRGVDSSG